MYTGIRLATRRMLGVVLLVSGCGGGGASTTASSVWIGPISSDDAVNYGAVKFTVATATPVSPAGGSEMLLAPTPPVPAQIDIHYTDPSPSQVHLTGTYDPASKILDVTNQNGYTISGFYDGASRMDGQFIGPSFSGNFITILNVTNTAKVQCGSYFRTAPVEKGIWGFLDYGGVVAGSAVTPTAATWALDGTSSGNTITFTGTPSGSGSYSGTGASGTYDAGGGNSGTWLTVKCEF